MPVLMSKIQVPEDRNQIICMFCGKEISVEEALEKQKSKIRKVLQKSMISIWIQQKLFLRS